MTVPGKPAAPDAADPRSVSSQLGRVIDDIGIPPCPDILVRINVEMGRDEPDMRRLDAMVSADVGIAAGLIALANSPYFGLRQRVRSAREALMMLGLGVAGRAIAGIVLRKVFPPSPVLRRFWDTSARIARVCGWLAGEGHISPRLRPDEAYTFGLFRDCGIPVLLQRCEGYEDALLRAASEPLLAFTAVEDAAYRANHAAVGCLLAQAWWLPDDIAFAILHHHDYPLLGSLAANPSRLSRQLAATALLAEHLVAAPAGAEPSAEWRKGGDICLAILGLGADDIPVLVEASGSVVADDV